MPSTGTPTLHTALGARGVSPSVTLSRAAGENDPGGRELADERVGDVERMDLAVDVELAHAARDELRVLRAEVEDQDRGVHGADSGRAARRICGRNGAARGRGAIACSTALT